MLKVNIQKEIPEGGKPRADIHAQGSVPELLSDVATVINSIYTQFRSTNLSTAVLFRRGLENMALDPNSPLWSTPDNQTGIIFNQ